MILIKLYDFFTQYDSFSYSTYKSTILKLSKINSLQDYILFQYILT